MTGSSISILRNWILQYLLYIWGLVKKLSAETKFPYEPVQIKWKFQITALGLWVYLIFNMRDPRENICRIYYNTTQQLHFWMEPMAYIVWKMDMQQFPKMYVLLQLLLLFYGSLCLHRQDTGCHKQLLKIQGCEVPALYTNTSYTIVASLDLLRRGGGGGTYLLCWAAIPCLHSIGKINTFFCAIPKTLCSAIGWASCFGIPWNMVFIKCKWAF